MADLAPNTVLDEYRLFARLGSGGMGEVWLAERVEGERSRAYAIKVATSETGARALRRQAWIQADLDHDGIVRVADLRLEREPPFVVFEYVEGESLRTRLRRDGALPQKQAARIASRIAAALHYAHGRGVAHGDLKPENILLGGPGVVKITDFGLGRTSAEAVAAGNSLLTRDLGGGTPGYLAPERLEGKPADALTDTYSFGVVLFEMLTGRLPQGRELPGDHVRFLDAAFDDVFDSCYTTRTRRTMLSLDSAATVLARVGAEDALIVPRDADCEADVREANGWAVEEDGPPRPPVSRPAPRPAGPVAVSPAPEPAASSKRPLVKFLVIFFVILWALSSAARSRREKARERALGARERAAARAPTQLPSRSAPIQSRWASGARFEREARDNELRTVRRRLDELRARSMSWPAAVRELERYFQSPSFTRYTYTMSLHRAWTVAARSRDDGGNVQLVDLNTPLPDPSRPTIAVDGENGPRPLYYELEEFGPFPDDGGGGDHR
jgi:serine/threonine protein kinase